jgi:hypothetical protein
MLEIIITLKEVTNNGKVIVYQLEIPVKTNKSKRILLNKAIQSKEK